MDNFLSSYHIMKFTLPFTAKLTDSSWLDFRTVCDKIFGTLCIFNNSFVQIVITFVSFTTISFFKIYEPPK